MAGGPDRDRHDNGISVNIVRPLAPDRTRVSFLSYVWDPARLDRGAGAALDRVEREDEAVVITG